jgi:hypothetical protein
VEDPRLKTDISQSIITSLGKTISFATKDLLADCDLPPELLSELDSDRYSWLRHHDREIFLYVCSLPLRISKLTEFSSIELAAKIVDRWQLLSDNSPPGDRFDDCQSPKIYNPADLKIELANNGFLLCYILPTAIAAWMNSRLDCHLNINSRIGNIDIESIKLEYIANRCQDYLELALDAGIFLKNESKLIYSKDFMPFSTYKLDTEVKLILTEPAELIAIDTICQLQDAITSNLPNTGTIFAKFIRAWIELEKVARCLGDTPLPTAIARCHLMEMYRNYARYLDRSFGAKRIS